MLMAVMKWANSIYHLLFHRVLEKILPRFFSGAAREYQNKGSIRENSSASNNGTATAIGNLSEESIKILRRDMALEYDFYEFVRQRFHRQRRELGILDDE